MTPFAACKAGIEGAVSKESAFPFLILFSSVVEGLQVGECERFVFFQRIRFR